MASWSQFGARLPAGVPAGGTMPGDDLTLAVVHAVVGLQRTDALALAQAIHDAVARVAQALCFHGPCVHHTAGELVARHKLARVCVVG